MKIDRILENDLVSDEIKKQQVKAAALSHSAYERKIEKLMLDFEETIEKLKDIYEHSPFNDRDNYYLLTQFTKNYPEAESLLYSYHFDLCRESLEKTYERFNSFHSELEANINRNED